MERDTCRERERKRGVVERKTGDRRRGRDLEGEIDVGRDIGGRETPSDGEKQGESKEREERDRKTETERRAEM